MLVPYVLLLALFEKVSYFFFILFYFILFYLFIYLFIFIFFFFFHFCSTLVIFYQNVGYKLYRLKTVHKGL